MAKWCRDVGGRCHPVDVRRWIGPGGPTICRRPGGAYQNAAFAASQPAQLNSAYANLQFSTPPQAAAPQAQPVAADNSPYSWATGQADDRDPRQSAGRDQPAGRILPRRIKRRLPSAQAAAAPQAGASPDVAHRPQHAARRRSGAAGRGAESVCPTAAFVHPTAAVVCSVATSRGAKSNGQSVRGSAGRAKSNGRRRADAPAPASRPRAASRPGREPASAGAPPLGFDGYSPVSMRNQWKWVPGDAKWGAIHRGRTYWFASQREQQQFLANPDYYSPALSGIDPVLGVGPRPDDSGTREYALDYDSQFYLFANEATLQQFTTDPARYAEQVRQAMAGQTGRIVR